MVASNRPEAQGAKRCRAAVVDSAPMRTRHCSAAPTVRLEREFDGAEGKTSLLNMTVEHLERSNARCGQFAASLFATGLEPAAAVTTTVRSWEAIGSETARWCRSVFELPDPISRRLEPGQKGRYGRAGHRTPEAIRDRTSPWRVALVGLRGREAGTDPVRAAWRPRRAVAVSSRRRRAMARERAAGLVSGRVGCACGDAGERCTPLGGPAAAAGRARRGSDSRVTTLRAPSRWGCALTGR